MATPTPTTPALAGLDVALKKAEAAMRPLIEATALYARATNAASLALSVPLAPLRLMTAAIGAAGDAAQKAAGLLSRPMDALQSGIAAVESQVASFVAKVNPAAAMKFTNAVDDLQAAIGKSLLPVLDKFTQVVRGIGAAFNGLTGDGQRVVQALAAGTVGLIAFGAAAAVVSAVLTGGIAPLLAAVGGGLAGGLAGVGFVMADLQPVLAQVGAVVTGVIDQFGAALGQLDGAGAVAAVLGTVGDVLGTVAGMVGRAMAAIAPGLNVVLKLFGELAPVLVPLAAALAALSLAPILAPLAVAAPLLYGLAKAAEALQVPLLAIGRLVMDVAGQVAAAVKSLFAMAGVNLDFEPPKGTPKDATGMAAKSVGTGDVTNALAQARQNAFALGAGTGPNPAVRTASATEELNKKVEEMKTYIRDIPNQIEQLPAKIAQAIRGYAREQVQDTGRKAEDYLRKEGGLAGEVAADSVRWLYQRIK